MQLSNIMFICSVLMLVMSTSATKSKTHRRMKSEPWRVFSLRKLTGHGRSMARSSNSASSVGEGRGLLKKFMMFRGMFQQPESNIIIITQPPLLPTPTVPVPIPPLPLPPPTTTGATTTAIAGRDDNDDRDMLGNQQRDHDDLNSNQMFNLNSGNFDDIVDNILGTNQMKPNPNPNPNTKWRRRSVHNPGTQQRRRNQQHRQRNQNRKRLQQIANNISKKTSSGANIYTMNGGGSNSNSNSNRISNTSNIGSISTPGGISFNANAQIQNIMNALRQQQTPIVYN